MARRCDSLFPGTPQRSGPPSNPGAQQLPPRAPCPLPCPSARVVLWRSQFPCLSRLLPTPRGDRAFVGNAGRTSQPCCWWGSALLSSWKSTNPQQWHLPTSAGDTGSGGDKELTGTVVGEGTAHTGLHVQTPTWAGSPARARPTAGAGRTEPTISGSTDFVLSRAPFCVTCPFKNVIWGFFPIFGAFGQLVPHPQWPLEMTIHGSSLLLDLPGAQTAADRLHAVCSRFLWGQPRATLPWSEASTSSETLTRPVDSWLRPPRPGVKADTRGAGISGWASSLARISSPPAVLSPD